jgi:hypothetical protein
MRITLLKLDKGEIFFGPGEAGFYMGDPDVAIKKPVVFPNAIYTKNFDDKTVNAYVITSEELLEKYRIRLISWECAPPIKNTFK